MKLNHQGRKEIRFIILVFVLITLILVASKIHILYQIDFMKNETNNIFEYPLQVSNAALKTKNEISKIHRHLDDIVLSGSNRLLLKNINEIEKHEQLINTNLYIIQEKCRDEKGKQLESQIRKELNEWKPFINQTIALVQSGHIDEARKLKREQEEKLIVPLENTILELYFTAQHEANRLKNNTNTMHTRFLNYSILIGIALLSLILVIAHYTVTRISGYILRTGHLSDVLSVIREVNQLIVREKNKEDLVQSICKILVTKQIYGNAWIVLFNDADQIDYIASADHSERFINLKNKLDNGWTPTCLQKNKYQDKNHIIIEDTLTSCPECPFSGLYASKGAFSIQLKYNGKVYGSLTLSLDAEYLQNNEELTLLDELAGDIAYALYNLETVEQLKVHEHSLLYVKELYENIINSVDNLIFVKDINFAYLVCNHAFEKFLGYPKEYIIGKTDYELFDQEVADFFREHDVKMFEEKKSLSNFEWITYPNGQKAYILTIKSPLYDSAGNLIGLVGNSVDVTEEKNIQDALEISNDKFEKAFNQTPTMILISHVGTGKIYDVNNTFEQLTGYTREEIIGQTVWDIRLWDSPQSRNNFLQKLSETGMIHGEKYTFFTKDNTPIITQVYASFVTINNEQYILAMGDDITEQEKAHQELQHALNELENKSRELQTVLQEAPTPIMLHNEAGKILMINKVWEDITGYSYDEIDTIEKWIQNACKQESPLKHADIDQFYSIGNKVDLGENKITAKDGNEMIWQVSSAPLGMINGKRTFVTSGMDITELKRKDEMMMAQSRHAAMGEMIGMIAHQWRQPIAGIAMDANNMLLDIAFETFDNTLAADYAQDILDQTNHLSKTIDDFRNFFKPDKSASAVKLEDIMEETLAIVKESIANHSITLKTSYLSDNYVNAFPRELMQVFVNIINNAKDSLISHQTPNAMIDIKIYDEKEYVCADICDNGGGIDPMILPKIFDPYFSTKDEKTGTGLGLYMSKMIIEEHLQGSIEASNNKDSVSGACFKVRLLKHDEDASDHSEH